MRTQRELDLLVDLAKLLRKYGPKTFEELAESISSPETTQCLSNILAQIAETARANRKTKRKIELGRESLIPKVLANIESKEPEKYQLLMRFYNDLTAKVALPSLRDIKGFAEDCGLPEIRAKSRQRAISPLISSLAKLPYEQLTTKTQLLRKYDVDDRSLEGWSRIILNSHRKSDEL